MLRIHGGSDGVSYLRSGLVICACSVALLATDTRASQSSPETAKAANATPEGTPFNRDWLLAEAERLAKQEYVQPSEQGLGPFGNLSYDQYRDIRFQKGASIWEREGRGFTIDLFHPGFIYKTPIELDLVVGGRARAVRFTPDVFEYGEDVPRPAADAMSGYSGFRVRYPINSPNKLDEFLLFQGASYFRAVGRGQIYGLSARGLAVNTAEKDGEEFPAFTRFWIERPPVAATSIVIHALLDSPSVTGAYSFTIEPGETTRMDVRCSLFPRVDLASVGIAPLTSMFLFDSSNHIRFDDYRPAVHDSDGVQIVTGASERLWRPLANPRELQISEFMDTDPRAFGLAQRAREYDDYEDAEARYDLRPSLWVQPQEKWGRGSVELVEIPSDKETHDNIVAFWRPAEPLHAGQRYDYNYRLQWLAVPPDELPVARVADTRIGQGRDRARRLIVVDFDRSGTIPEDLHPEVTSSAGTISNVTGLPVPSVHQYRASFELDPENKDAIELRLVLVSNGKGWSETWLYRWTK